MNTPHLYEKVSALAAKDYRNIEIFKQLGIEFCCSENKTLEEAGREAGVTVEQINLAVKRAQEMKSVHSENFNEWALDSLIDYVTKYYHSGLKKSIAIIYDLAQKVSYKHCKKHPELSKLTIALFLFFDDLSFNLKAEEQLLFPNIMQLVGNKLQNQPIFYNNQGSLKDLVLTMRHEHQAAIQILKLFREITNDFLIPADAGNSYKYLFKKMVQFENDLILHIHLENNILFPKVINMIEELREKEQKLVANSVNVNSSLIRYHKQTS